VFILIEAVLTKTLASHVVNFYWRKRLYVPFSFKRSRMTEMR
jgi:hypothetical protein